MNRSVRKLLLTAHVTFSVGWLGAVAAFLGLGVVGLTSGEAETVRGAYLVMEPAAWFVLVPLAVASLVTGLSRDSRRRGACSRHYWVVFKLLINLFATLVLLLYMETFEALAGVAADRTEELGAVRNASPLLHACAAMILLLAATALAVYKPRGLTPYGQRRERERRLAAKA
jgi:hypothetical protein